MKDGRKKRKATKQAWHHRQFNGSNEKDSGGGRVPHSLARAGLVLPQGKREAGVTLQEHSAQSVNVNTLGPSGDLLRKEAACGRDRGAFGWRLGGGSGRPGAIVLWRRREECIFPGGVWSVVKFERKSEWK